MTVAQLIEQLQQFPQDLQVRALCGDISMYITDKYYDGDPANPYCPIIQALVIT